MRTKRVSYSAVQSVEEPRDTRKKVDVTNILVLVLLETSTTASYCTKCVRLGKYMYPECEPPHRLSVYSFFRAVEEAKVGRRHSQHT